MKKQAQTQQETRKRELDGVVVRKSGDKTVSVEVVRVIAHPVYGKRIKRTKRYLVHDEANAATVGQMVRIRESRPMSARKRWAVISQGGKTV